MKTSGWNENKSKRFMATLDTFLDSYQAFYMNSKGLYWSLKSDENSENDNRSASRKEDYKHQYENMV